MNNHICDTYVKVDELLNSSTPIIWVYTQDYYRVCSKLTRVSWANNCQVHTWDIVNGLTTYVVDETTVIDVKNGKFNDYQKVFNLENFKIKAAITHLKKDDTEGYLELISFLFEKSIEIEPSEKKEVFILMDLHKYLSDLKFLTYLREIYCSHKSGENFAIIILSPYVKLPVEIEKYISVVHAKNPNKFDLSIRLKSLFKDKYDIIASSPSFNNLLDSALGLTDAEAITAFKVCDFKHELIGENAIFEILKQKEQIIKKSGILEYIHTDCSFDDSTGGLGRLKNWIIQRRIAFDESASKFDIPTPKGVLLIGVPGCGKSLSAKCISKEWKLPLLKLDLGKVFSAEVGSSEQNMRNIISIAESISPCVLWIDEVDKGFSTQTRESDGGTNARVLSTILTWMEEKTTPVFVVATANNVNNMPSELLRKGRFDEIFFIDLPSFNERCEILNKIVKKLKFSKLNADNIEKIAMKTQNFSGAELQELIKASLFIAYNKNKDAPSLSEPDVIEALDSTITLYQTMESQIQKMREWAIVRAVPASSEIDVYHKKSTITTYVN